MTEIESLIDQMTLEEKISMLAGADWWHTVPVKRMGIPAMKVTDGPVGARGAGFSAGPTSACFPAGVALAATWDPNLVKRVGQALAEEIQAKGAQILLAPTVNLHRSPLAGRNFECYSEDPYLTAQMATAYINGIQSGGVGACIKHFVCNDSEFERQSISSEVGERALRELYLRPFEVAVREAKPWAVMSSYNRINGTFASENAHLLLDILKGEWSFEGVVISDWFGTYSPNVAKGGLDLEMPGPARWMGEKALKAVQSGEASEESIDDKVRRLLRTLDKAGLFEHPELSPEQAIDNPEHHRLAREVASEAIVLLKNDKSLLPLDTNAKSIAVIGENAKQPSFIGGGSCRVRPHYVVSPLAGIQNRAGESVQISYALGCATRKNPSPLDKSWLADGITLQYFSNRDLAGDPVHTDTTDKLEITWVIDTVPAVIDLANFSVRLTGVLSVPESGPYELSLSSIGKSRLFIDGDLIADADREDTFFGKEGGERVEISLEAGQTHQLRIEYASQPGSFLQSLRVGCRQKVPDDSIQQAAALAAECDVAIVFAGLTDEWESEGFDRPDMELPGDQARLIEQVAAANPNTIVVLNVGSPLHMSWLDKVAAVVQAWYLGQETGNAIADVLFGDVNPSGKLPTTFPKHLQDNPAYLNYPGVNGKVLYGEGLFIGYRYYDKKDIAPLFPFGYGLSYTTFTYRNLKLSKPKYVAGDTIQFSIDVENTGGRAGKEVIQVYVRDVQSRLMRPEKELKAFAKVALEPGETKTVAFTLDQEALSYYDPASKRWVAEAGEFQVLVGSSSQDIHMVESFDFASESSSR